MAHQAITSNNLNMLVDKPVSGLRCELLSDKLLAPGRRRNRLCEVLVRDARRLSRHYVWASVRTHGHCGTRRQLSKVLHSSGYTFMRSRPINAMAVTRPHLARAVTTARKNGGLGSSHTAPFGTA